MFRNTVAIRMTFGLVMMTISSLMLANLLGLVPNEADLRNQRRVDLCEALAVSCSLLAQRSDAQGIAANLKLAMNRNPDIVGMALHRNDGRVVFTTDASTAASSSASPSQDPEADGGANHLSVAIVREGKTWGELHVEFQSAGGVRGLSQEYPLLRLLLFCGVVNAIGILFYLGRTLTYLDPSKAVPDRVRAAFDTLAEGLVVLDSQDRIVLANEAFAEQVECSPDELQGMPVENFNWRNHDEEVWPWRVTAECNQTSVGAKMSLATAKQGERTFLVNTAPIRGDSGEQRGVLASFDDITVLEAKKSEMQNMLHELRESREEIKTRNQELQILATRDPLTNCINRRTFFEWFQREWDAWQDSQKVLSCAMVDIDHFKKINDTYGHSTGDEVLKVVSRTMLQNCREEDIVCRYGGEEFCVLMPGLVLEEAEAFMERIRRAVKSLGFSAEQLTVSVSIGVSSIVLGADSQQSLLDEADKSLYVAKRGGRDRVRRWDSLTEEELTNEVDTGGREADGDAGNVDEPIPFPAVASLLTALSFRDPATAAHSTRVAELSVANARGLMTVSEAYVLEIAALLHDIGKIGVPDKILLKPGPLTADEWEIMHVHDRIGVDIVESSFSNPMLVDIVRYHHAWYQSREAEPDMPFGDDIPIGARIVSIADAYDAMISDRAYRKGCSQAEAFAELRRCAGIQFDPRLVERFIAVVSDYHGPEQLAVQSKQAALELGVEIERLAHALDRESPQEISLLAKRVEQTAARNQVDEIQGLAAAICIAAEDDPDLHQLISMTRDLLDMCRVAQRLHVRSTPESEAADRSRRSVAGATSPN